MTLLLKQIFSLFQLLNSDKGSVSIALGVCCGFILGMTPSLSLQSLVIFLLLFIFRIQIGAALVTAFFFSFIAWLLDPAYHKIGSIILNLEALQSTFTSLYNMPIIPFTRFNNTVVMGSGVMAFALTPIVYFLSLFLVNKYRATVVARFKETKAWKIWKATTFFKLYEKYTQYS